jgi:hypothetical protein
MTELTHQPLPDDAFAGWQKVATHSHHLRSGDRCMAEANRDLVDWCRRLGVAAMGVGSPWEPVSRDHYRQYEGIHRDLYYSPAFDPETVMDREPIAALFSELNRERPDGPHLVVRLPLRQAGLARLLPGPPDRVLRG